MSHNSKLILKGDFLKEVSSSVDGLTESWLSLKEKPLCQDKQWWGNKRKQTFGGQVFLIAAKDVVGQGEIL